MSLRNHIRCGSALALPLCLMLSACGGGGGSEVASIPPPPLPTPTPTPAVTLDVKTTWLDSLGTKVGTYDLFGRLTTTPANGGTPSHRAMNPGEFTITTSQPVANGDFAHELSLPAGLLAGGQTSSGKFEPRMFWDISASPLSMNPDPYGDWEQLLGQRLTVFLKHADGSEEEAMSYDFRRGSSQTSATASGPVSALTYDIGYSYVAMGEWSSPAVQPGAPPQRSVDLLFVHGDRTPDSGIPISGTATYDAHSLSLLSYGYSAYPGIPFTLAADFGQRTMSAQISQDYHYDDERSAGAAAILGLHVNGSAPFGNSGAFDIPLTGTANYSATNAVATPPSETVTGTMNGAFFGPHAENVGGTFGLNRSDGTLMIQDAFVGQQHKP